MATPQPYPAAATAARLSATDAALLTKRRPPIMRIVGGGGAPAPRPIPEDRLAISATEPDWSREARRRWWEPQKALLRTIRRHQRWYARRGPLARLVCKVYAARHRLLSVVTGTDIPLSVQIGGGLLIPHPNGVVIHGRATIGPNCLIFQQVTLGEGGRVPGVPTLGGHVDVGAGAKLLGGITVGDHARIGANAVVLCDVPPGRLAVGVPARIV